MIINYIESKKLSWLVKWTHVINLPKLIGFSSLKSLVKLFLLFLITLETGFANPPQEVMGSRSC